MSIVCAIAGHKASGKTIWNAGTHFSQCLRCRSDLVEQGGRWDEPPPWFRVVWKPREARGEEAPLELTADLAAEVAPIPSSEDVRSGYDRRTSSGSTPASLRVERRGGGDRRKGRKTQAISRA